jgi:hypothetical protein
MRDLALSAGHTREGVLADEPALGESWDALLATVVRLGLVVDVQPTLRDSSFNTGDIGPRGQQTLGPKKWQVTGFGARLYDRVRNAGTAAR